MVIQAAVNEAVEQVGFLGELKALIKQEMQLEIVWDDVASEEAEVEVAPLMLFEEEDYALMFEQVMDKQMSGRPMIARNGAWRSASTEDVQKYCNPDQAMQSEYLYQFLDLSAPAGISLEVLEAYLEDKGILSGQHQTFLEAASTYHINEGYLVAHAILETGNGTSRLATGITYNGVKVYNMFGIKAVDSDPHGQGAAYAYKMGWTTPEKAIIGGAKYISEQYINHPEYAQNTLYKMRWNPATPGTHQYATDVAWATKQAKKIEGIYEQLQGADKVFRIPSYKK